jgi:hypothetical protein
MRLTDTLPRGAVLAAGLFLAMACQDDISGPTKLATAPLLDIDISPAAAPALPAATFTLNSTRTQLTVTLDSLPQLPTGYAYQLLLVDSVRAANGTTANAIVASGAIATTTACV